MEKRKRNQKSYRKTMGQLPGEGINMKKAVILGGIITIAVLVLILIIFAILAGSKKERSDTAPDAAKKSSTKTPIIVEEKEPDSGMDSDVLIRWMAELDRICAGKDGSAAQSAYEVMKLEGSIPGKVFNGSKGINAVSVSMNSLDRDNGSDGQDGSDAAGNNGTDGLSGKDGAGGRGETIKGEKGDKGDKGDKGQNATGKDGTQGLKGDQGQAGASVFIIYADDMQGTNAANHPTETSKYIGTYTGTSMPSSYSQYSWAQYRSYILLPRKNADGTTTLQIK